ncbi:MAG: phosphoribosylglycinamide formyltransferase [Bacteroidia bacterium]
MINAAIFASGEGTNAENLMRYFANDPRIRIKLVITNRDDAGVIARAEKHKKIVQIISREALNSYTEKIIEFLRSEKIDLIILAGFLLQVPDAIVAAFPGKIVNIHPALLPKYGGKGMYGMHVHKAVIEHKETESGITVHYVNNEYDKGEIILQAACKVEANDTPETLAQKVRELEHDHFPKAIERLLNSHAS